MYALNIYIDNVLNRTWYYRSYSDAVEDYASFKDLEEESDLYRFTVVKCEEWIYPNSPDSPNVLDRYILDTMNGS